MKILRLDSKPGSTLLKTQIVVLLIAVAWLLMLGGCAWWDSVVGMNPDPEALDSLESGVAAGTAIARTVAPWTGPAAPIILLATNLINSLATGIITRGRARRGGATAVAAPLEAARDKTLEASLSKDGKKFMVVDLTKAHAGHVAAKVNGLIAEATA